jgi:Ca2+-binding EF-hand superfamily protein
MKIKMIVLLLLSAGFTMAQNDNSGGKPPTAAELISKLDKDGDGKISKTEFDGPAEHFTQFDKNGDGYLSTDEIPSGPPQRGDR